jgi:hypothetical protein
VRDFTLVNLEAFELGAEIIFKISLFVFVKELTRIFDTTNVVAIRTIYDSPQESHFSSALIDCSQESFILFNGTAF